MTTPYRILTPPVPYDAPGHFKRVKELLATYPLRTGQAFERYVDAFIDEIPERYRPTFKHLLLALLRDEGVFISLGDKPMPADEITHAIYSRHELFLNHWQENIEKITAVLVNFINTVAEHLPTGTGSFTLSLVELLPDPQFFVERLFSHYRDKPFPRFREQFLRNVFDATGMDYDREYTDAQLDKLIFPTLSDLSAVQLAHTYLKNTPLLELFRMPVPFSIPNTVRNEHFLMIARTGSGKTQFIQRDILDNLMRRDPPGMIVIDSQNQMIPQLEKLQVVKDRIVIIDPFDEKPPALNMFIYPRPPIDDPNLKEAIEANTLQQFAWIFSALDQELTGRQTTLFTFTSRILLSMQSNMQTLLDLMRIEKPGELKASKFWPFIERTDEQTRYFFDNRFCTNDYNKTKGGVADRLLGVLRVPAFNRMFMAPDNRLDLYTALANRKLVVFNTHKSRLGNDASAILGRYAISLYIRAAFERELDTDPPPAFLYVDEASEYFGKKDSSDTLFTQLRKYNCGTFVAFQDLSQLGEQHQTLIANTTTKLTGGLSVADARKLAPDMRTTEEELMSIRKVRDAFEIMCFVNNVTPRALKLTFPYGAVEHAPQMDKVAHAELRERNRTRLSSQTATKPSAPPTPAMPERTGQPQSPAPDRIAPEPSPFEIKPGKKW